MKVQTTRDDRIGKQLISIRDFLNKININQGTTEILDFVNYSYSPPLLAVFFAAFLEKFSSFTPTNTNSSNYLNYQYFPNGLNINEFESWEDILSSYKTKTYLPLIKFSTFKDEESTTKRNNLLSHVISVIENITKIPVNYYSAFSYLISEITDNIIDHSNAEYGWLAFQYYRSKKYLDLCIADSGIGLLQSYKNYNGEKDYSNINNHLTALNYAIKGESTKHLHERGYGIHTSREMLVNGLKGTFIMYTGNALLANNDLLDIKANYSGTLVLVRIPCAKFCSDFTIYPYVE